MSKNSVSGILQSYGLYLAWVTSLIATGGSLFFSEVLKYVPCDLCWFQRIFMYPLVILLGIAGFTHDRSIRKYVLPLSITGGSISLYHYLQQMVPGLAEILPCSSGNPCNLDYLNWLGFITIPFLALTAFLMITVFLWFTEKE